MLGASIRLCAAIVLAVGALKGAHAYSSIALADEETPRTITRGWSPQSQQEADKDAIDKCKTLADANRLGMLGVVCHVVQRQTIPGHGAVVCDDKVCASGYGSSETAARDDAGQNCRKASKAPARCGAGSFAWRDDKVSGRAELDAAQAAKTSTSVISNAPTALYGLLVGRTQLANIPPCGGESIAKGQPYCHNVMRINDQDPDQAMYQALQLRRIDIVINSEMFDCSRLYSNPIVGTFCWAETWVTRDGIVRRMKMATSLTAANAIRADLSAKFGKPSKESATDWLDNRTGQVLYQTPVLSWLTDDYQLFFHTKAPIAFDNRTGDRGMIEMFDMSVLKQVWDYDKRQPAQRKM